MDMPDITDDIIHGANEIAAFLGGDFKPRQVYHMAEKRAKGLDGAAPIHKVPGLGVTARKSELRRFFSLSKTF